MQRKNVSVAMPYPTCRSLTFLWTKITSDLEGEEELCVCVCAHLHTRSYIPWGSHLGVLKPVF